MGDEPPRYRHQGIRTVIHEQYALETHKGLQTERAVLLLIRNFYTGKEELTSVEWLEKAGKIVSYQWDIM
ncbi:MAG: hypothetical protein AAB422_06705 [Planctomycetota bacterium]